MSLHVVKCWLSFCLLHCMKSYLYRSSAADALPLTFQLWLWCPVGVLLACNPHMKAYSCVPPMSRTGIWSWLFPYKPSAGQTRCIQSHRLQTAGWGVKGNANGFGFIIHWNTESCNLKLNYSEKVWCNAQSSLWYFGKVSKGLLARWGWAFFLFH